MIDILLVSASKGQTVCKAGCMCSHRLIGYSHLPLATVSTILFALGYAVPR